MDNKVPFLAPGCFGSALTFKSDDIVCGGCPFRDGCEPMHQKSLEAMRAKLGIVAPKRTRTVVEKVATNDIPERMGLPKKVRELLASLDKVGVDFKQKMKEAINPFTGLGKMRYMEIACHLIMRLPAPVTQQTIRLGLKTKLDWADGTASAHARMAVQALEHLEVVEVADSGEIKVRN